MKCRRCGYEWKIQRKPSAIRQVVQRPLEFRAEARSEVKEAGGPFLEEPQRPPASSAIAGPEEEQVVGLAWLLHWVDQGVVTWAI